MNKEIIFTFVFGAAIGSFITWQFVEEKYKALAQEEIESSKEAIARRRTQTTNDKESDNEQIEIQKKAEAAKSKPDITNYTTKIKECGYTDYSNISKKEQAVSPVLDDENDDLTDNRVPFVISPDDFGEYDYDIISLTYYSDKALTDQSDELIENVAATVGTEALTIFDNSFDDAVYVRNDRLKTDFEILYDRRKYTDVVPTSTHSMEE